MQFVAAGALAAILYRVKARKHITMADAPDAKRRKIDGGDSAAAPAAPADDGRGALLLRAGEAWWTGPDGAALLDNATVVGEEHFASDGGGGAAGRVIGTHNGKFHCDEVLACSMLLLLPEFRGCTIVRTRDGDALKQCHIVVDVGGEYDDAARRFDHHQPSFTGTMEALNRRIKLSSAGLVYKHYGRALVAHVARAAFGAELAADDLETVYKKLYAGFVEHVDAIDNGVDIQRSGSPRYKVTSDLSSRVDRLNPHWNEPAPAGGRAGKHAREHARFRRALRVAAEELLGHLQRWVLSWLPARVRVARAVSAAVERGEPALPGAAANKGEVLVLEEFCPWRGHLGDLEEERGLGPVAKYCVFADSRGTSWRVQAVSERPGSFETRKGLPKAWRGLRDAELDAAAGVDGCVFVHASGFIGGNKTREGAIAMAAKALAM